MSAPAMSVVIGFRDWGVERLRRSVASLHRALGATDRKSTRLNSSHGEQSRMPSSA